MKTYLDEGTLAGFFREADFPANPEAITVAEFADMVEVSEQLIVGSFNMNFLDPDTDPERTWGTKGNSVEPTIENYEVGGTMRRDRDNTGATTTKDPMKLFEHREVVLFIKRQGYPFDVGLATGQEYEFFKVMVSKRNPLGNPDGTTEKLDLSTLPQGLCGTGVVAA